MTILPPEECFEERVTIVNWSKYQHDATKSKMPWMRLHKALLDKPEFWMLSDFETRILLCVWLITLEKGLPKHEDVLTFQNQTFAQFLRWRLRYSEDRLEEIEVGLRNLEFQGFIQVVHTLGKSSSHIRENVGKEPGKNREEVRKEPGKSSFQTIPKMGIDNRVEENRIEFTADAAGEDVEEEEVVASATNSSQEDERWSQLDEEWAEWDREHPQGEESSQEEEDECKPVTTISLPEATSFEEYKRNKIRQAMSDTSESTQFQEDDSWMEDTPAPSLEDEPADPMAMLLGMVDQLTQSPAVEQEEPSGWDEEEEPEPDFEYSTDDEYLERVWHTHNFIATQFYNASTPWKVDWTTFSQRSANEQVTEILRGYAWTLIENQVHPDDFVHYYFTQWFNYKNESLAFNKEGKPLTETPGIGFPSRKWLCEMGDEVVAKLLDNPGWKSDYFPYPEEFGEVANA